MFIMFIHQEDYVLFVFWFSEDTSVDLKMKHYHKGLLSTFWIKHIYYLCVFEFIVAFSDSPELFMTLILNNCKSIVVDSFGKAVQCED